MSEINSDFENEIIEKITLEEYIKQFDPEIRNIFYDAYGRSLEAMPQKLLQSNMSMDRLLEGLLKVNNVKSQKIILMRFGFVTGSTMTIEEVATELGITRERVRLIESNFIRRLGPHARRKRSISDFYNK